MRMPGFDYAVRVSGCPNTDADGFEVYNHKTGEVESWHRWCRDADDRFWALYDRSRAAQPLARSA